MPFKTCSRSRNCGGVSSSRSGSWRFIVLVHTFRLPELIRCDLKVWGEVAGTLLGVLDFFGRKLSYDLCLCTWRHALYYGVDHNAADARTFACDQRIQEEGEVGRQKMNQWTRYLTVVLCSVQTFFVATWLHRNGIIAETWWATSMVVITLTTGTIFVMWLGEQITERGVGNGISLLIFCWYRDRSAPRPDPDQ